jgi:hypothetical protein
LAKMAKMTEIDGINGIKTEIDGIKDTDMLWK